MQQPKVKSSIPGTPNPEPLGEDAFQLHMKNSSNPTSPELDVIVQLYDAIRTLRRNRQKAKERRLIANFEQKLQNGLQNMDSRLKAADDPFLQRSTLVTFHKEILFACYVELQDYVTMAHPQVGSILQALMSITANLFREYPRIINDMHSAYVQKLDEIHKQLEKSEKECMDLLAATEQLERTAIRQAAKIKQHQERNYSNFKVPGSTSNTTRPGTPGSTGSSELKPQASQNNIRKIPILLESGLVSIFLDSWLIKKSDAEPKAKTPNSGKKKQLPKDPNAEPGKITSPPAKTPPSYSGMYTEFLKNKYTNLWLENTTASMIAPHTAVQDDLPTNTRKKLPEKVISMRGISLVKLKEIINDIYDSKEKYDQKCLEAKLPLETMEQHVFTWLNLQYGLKSLILDWAEALHNAIEKYSKVDNDILVFKRILNNDIDEGYRATASLVKDKGSKLLKLYLRGQNPSKTQPEIAALYRKKMTTYPLEENEWKTILHHMYVDEDEQALVPKVLEKIKENQLLEQFDPSNYISDVPLNDYKNQDNFISYSDFIKVLLEYQLRAREKFLLKFKHLFRLFDRDNNGILQRSEFVDLVRSVSPIKSRDDLLSLLKEVDPAEHSKITFSQCVNALSNELIEMTSYRTEETPSSRDTVS